MKAIFFIIMISILFVALIIFNESDTIGEYHDLSYNTITGMTIVNMKDDTNAINIPTKISKHIYVFLSEIKPEKTYEADNNKELTNINYLIVVDEMTKSYYITIGDDFIIISFDNISDNDITKKTIHIVNDKIIDELEELIDTQLKRAN